MDVKDRILQYANTKQISENSLEKRLGIARSYFKNTAKVSVDVAVKFLSEFADISPDWLLMGEGDMYRQKDTIKQRGSVIPIAHSKTPERLYPVSEFDLYDIDVSAGFSRLLSEDCGQESLGKISIPNMPRCDGAVKVAGDSMYPLLKSGDIIAFRKLNSLDSILYGEMYIVQIECDSDISVVVKYVKRSEMGEDYLNLVSYNKEYDPKDVRKENITALARVILCIRQFSI